MTTTADLLWLDHLRRLGAAQFRARLVCEPNWLCQTRQEREAWAQGYAEAQGTALARSARDLIPAEVSP